MKFYRVFRNGYEGVGEVFTNRDDAYGEAARMKRNFQKSVEERIERLARLGIGGGVIQDEIFLAFECDEQGNRAH